MTNPATPYISSYADTAYLECKSNLDLNISAIKAQYTLNGAFGSSGMYVSIGEAILASEQSFYADLLAAVKYYQGFSDILISEVYEIYNSYAALFQTYASDLGSSSSNYNNLITQDLNSRPLKIVNPLI